eukprot:6175370-Pleurochrysis_carterae.AAC.2
MHTAASTSQRFSLVRTRQGYVSAFEAMSLACEGCKNTKGYKAAKRASARESVQVRLCVSNPSACACDCAQKCW